MHTLFSDYRGISHIVTSEGVSTFTTVATDLSRRELLAGSPALEWTSLSNEVLPAITLDRLENTGESVRRSLYRQPQGFSQPLSAASAARTFQGALYAAFRSGFDPLRSGIYLHRDGSGWEGDVLLMKEPFEPWLLVDIDGPLVGSPRVFYVRNVWCRAAPSGTFAMFSGAAVPEPSTQVARPISGFPRPNPRFHSRTVDPTSIFGGTSSAASRRSPATLCVMRIKWTTPRFGNATCVCPRKRALQASAVP